MSLTRTDREYFNLYESLNAPERIAVDAAYTAAREAFDAHGVAPANDDRAAALTAALTRYLLEAGRTA